MSENQKMVMNELADLFSKLRGRIFEDISKSKGMSNDTKFLLISEYAETIEDIRHLVIELVES